MTFKPTQNRAIISIDSEKKNSHKFADGTEIKLERNWNNLNRREIAPVNGVVIEAENIPKGAEVIIHHNSDHAVNELFNYKPLDGSAIASNIKYYSIPEYNCYLYREENTDTWLPCKNFATALRCFIPYKGFMVGIKPARLKDRLLITSGQHKGKVCIVAHAADYQMCFQGIDGREANVIRLRTFDEPCMEREEILATDEEWTNKYNEGKLLVGLTATDCQPIGGIKPNISDPIFNGLDFGEFTPTDAKTREKYFKENKAMMEDCLLDNPNKT